MRGIPYGGENTAHGHGDTVLMSLARTVDGYGTSVASMCGRFVATRPPSVIAARYGARIATSEVFGPRYNIAPTMPIAIVFSYRDGLLVEEASWGLIPSWSRDRSGASKMINARVEGLTQRPSFRPLLARHRCIVPMDGFYEWGSDRRPRYVHDRSGDLLDVAGLWTTWRDPDLDMTVRTCTVVTTEATGDLAAVHHRMPLILDGDGIDDWLGSDVLGEGELESLATRAHDRSASVLELHEVSTAVNRVGRQGPELIEARPAEPDQGQLFAT